MICGLLGIFKKKQILMILLDVNQKQCYLISKYKKKQTVESCLQFYDLSDISVNK